MSSFDSLTYAHTLPFFLPCSVCELCCECCHGQGQGVIWSFLSREEDRVSGFLLGPWVWSWVGTAQKWALMMQWLLSLCKGSLHQSTFLSKTS
jgi:hypothetical protein